MPRLREAGFSILEALIAATIFAVAIVTLVQLVMQSAGQSVRTELATVALTLAQSKLEALRAVPFDFDANGLRREGAQLALSPADAHDRDVPPYIEALDRFSALLPRGAPAAYLRRWSITNAEQDVDTRVLIVCVTPVGIRAAAVRASCVWGIRTRQP